MPRKIKTVSKRRDALNRLRMFAGLPSQTIDSLAEVAEWRAFAPMECMCQQGDPALGVFGLVTGSAKVTLNDANGKETILGFAGSGDIFGDIGCIDGGTEPAVVVALENCTTLFIPRQHFMTLVDESPDLQRRILRNWATTIRLLLLRSHEQAHLDIPTRLAKRLLDIHDIMGSTKAGDGYRLPIALSQKDLGDLIEATRESVNKCMREWTRAKIVSHARGVVTILNETLLREAAQGALPADDRRSLVYSMRRAVFSLRLGR
jgi:CRP/FNR family cyclic AMP-dependent transcriptional regulator